MSSDASPSIVGIDNVDAPLVTLDTLQENFAAATASQENGYYYEARIVLDDNLLSQSDMDLAKNLCSKIGDCDHYRYILKTVNASTVRRGVASFYANCSQSAATAKATNANKEDNDNTAVRRRQRNTKQRKRYDCRGRISASIDRIAKQAHISLQHDIRHELPEPSRKTPAPVKDFIRNETARGRSAKEIHADVKERFPDANVTPAQTYYWWREYRLANENLVIGVMDPAAMAAAAAAAAAVAAAATMSSSSSTPSSPAIVFPTPSATTTESVQTNVISTDDINQQQQPDSEALSNDKDL